MNVKAVVLCTGTYLRARCLCGESITYTGPNGLQAANHLTDSLKAMGIEMRRFKTGTPARMDKRSLDFSKMEEQLGDERIVPFSFSTDPESVQKEQASCWLTYTNENTHEIIRNNLDRLLSMPVLLRVPVPDIVLPLRTRSLNLPKKRDIRYLSSQKVCTRMKCTLAACLLLCRKMYS